MSDPKKPSKRAKKPKQDQIVVTNQEPPLNQHENELSKLDRINIDRVIAQAFELYKDELLHKKTKFTDLSHLSTICEEYLSSFALIGYSMQNEKVVILNTPSSKDESAIIDLLRETLLQILNNRN